MKWFIPLLVFISFSTHAQQGPLKLEITDYGFLTSFPILQPLLDDYLITVEENLNNDQPIKDPERIMKGTVNSTAISSRGTGLDRVNMMENFSLGASLGAAADFDKDSGLKDEDLTGLGAAAAIVLGKKLDEKTDLFFNIGGLSHSRTLPGVYESDLDAEITTFNMGVHARKKILEGSGDSLWGWSGLFLSFGYEYNNNELEFENELNEDIDVDLGGQAVLQGRLKGFPTYTIKTETHSLPLELFSAVHFLKIFSFYAGAGLDLNFGESRGTGDLKARAFSPLACVSGVCTNLNVPEVEVTAQMNARSRVDPLTLRAFGGTQISLGPVKIFGEVNKVIGNEVLGVSTGIRAVF